MTYTEQRVFELGQRVSKLERQVAFLMQELGLAYQDPPNDMASPEILDLLQRGLKLQAIKLYREETGVGLKQAKEFIESLEQNL